MRLLIISHTPHYRTPDGVFGWAPTIREIDALASIFTEVVHLAPVYDQPAPESTLPYAAVNVTYVPVAPAGGDGLKRKIDILLAYPGYTLRMLSEMKRCDMVHVRFPANISLLALLLLYLRRTPQHRWFKYAGNWFGAVGEPAAYQLQRLMLQPHLHGGIVTVNGNDGDRHEHIRVFRNPSFSTEEYEVARQTAIIKSLSSPVRILFCGRLEREKGVFIVCDIAVELQRRAIDYRMVFIGDGPDMTACVQMIEASGCEERVCFLGWLKPEDIIPHYRESHFLVLPSRASEGWPKVLSEAMAWGVVPIASAVSSIPLLLRRFRCGTVVYTANPVDYVDAIEAYMSDHTKWVHEISAATDAAGEFTYEVHLANVQSIIGH